MERNDVSAVRRRRSRGAYAALEHQVARIAVDDPLDDLGEDRPFGLDGSSADETVHVIVDAPDERCLGHARAHRFDDDPRNHVAQARAIDASFVNQLAADIAARIIGANDVGGSLTGGSSRPESIEETTGPLIRGNGRRKGSRINFRCGRPFGRWSHGSDAFIGAVAGQGPRASRSFAFKASDGVEQKRMFATFCYPRARRDRPGRRSHLYADVVQTSRRAPTDTSRAWA
jgi:hypothetical protein